jgi:2-dehydro-3-deoxyphosphogluconate aldolase / (4S)-4-hydroxy-2-oxoglutarate aldolase
MKQQVLQLIDATRLVAIIRLDDLSQAVEIGRSLAAGGILAQEFTLTNPDAISAAHAVRQALRSEYGSGVAVGIGSVRNGREAAAAISGGADFIVSPITHPDVLAACREAGVAVMPGAYTPTEIAAAWEAGADVVKVFPARGLGPGFIKDVLAPLPYLKLMPTGGVDASNMANYFQAGAVAVGIGGNLIDAAAIARGDWQAVTETARRHADAAKP